MKPRRLTPAETVAAWNQIATAALAGNWDRAKGTELEALLIGLRATDTETCRRAVMKMEPKPRAVPKAQDAK